MLKRYLICSAIVLIGALGSLPAIAQDRYCTDDGPRVLKVALYPIIPEAADAELRIKSKFEQGCPGLELRIIADGDNYYREGKGILVTNADVYEVDSVFFVDFLDQKHPLPIPAALLADSGPVIPNAKAIASAGGITYGVPHWACGNFLIFRKDHPQLHDLSKPDDAAAIFKEPRQGLLMDLKGTTTLGELYLASLLAHYGSPAAALAKIDPAQVPDAYAVSALKRFMAMEPPEFGRDLGYHYREGFYARQLARGNASALVGYSEEMFYLLNETAQSCLSGECLKEDDLDVGQWPFADEGAHPIAWTDMYMLDGKLTGATLRDAEAFIRFMMSVATYEELLVPANGASPRYLLPAREDLYLDTKLLNAAKLYPRFHELIGAATPVTGLHLNANLRAISPRVDCALSGTTC